MNQQHDDGLVQCALWLAMWPIVVLVFVAWLVGPRLLILPNWFQETGSDEDAMKHSGAGA